MKQAAWFFLLVLSACNENLSHIPPPMDQFFSPSGVALTSVAGGNAVAGGHQALLVVSSNFDLHYDKTTGSTLLSVDPDLFDAASGVGGSLGRPGGALVKLGPGSQFGSYAGSVAIADDVTCPGVPGGPQAFVASRYVGSLYRFGLQDGAVVPCTRGDPCQFDLDKDLLDPAPVGLSCRADGLRRSLWVSYLRSPNIGGVRAGTGWLSEFDLADMRKGPRTIALAPGPVGDMTYDALTDRLYAVGRFAGLTAPLYILDLLPCVHDSVTSTGTSVCPTPRLQTVDLFPSVGGAELVGIALSNPQPGLPRLAYVSARVYDEAYAAATYSRPPYDVGGVLFVLEIDEGVSGEPAARVRQIVQLGLGAGSVKVLPVRPGLGDLVVVPSAGDGTLQLFDDEIHAITRIVSIDKATGAPEAGRAPNAMVVRDLGTEALVYVAAFSDWTVSVLRVPLASPEQADLLRYPPGHALAGKPMRIGREKQ
jgi:hypothetical protein